MYQLSCRKIVSFEGSVYKRYSSYLVIVEVNSGDCEFKSLFYPGKQKKAAEYLLMDCGQRDGHVSKIVLKDREKEIVAYAAHILHFP